MTSDEEVMPVHPSTTDDPGYVMRAAVPTVTPVTTGSDLPTGAAHTLSLLAEGSA